MMKKIILKKIKKSVDLYIKKALYLGINKL
jgi:hypothetical protein